MPYPFVLGDIEVTCERRSQVLASLCPWIPQRWHFQP